MSEIGFVRNPRFAPATPGGWNDPDMLETGNGGMSEDEYRTHMTLWVMSAVPLMMGHDVRTTSSVARALLLNREVIAIDQDAAGVHGKAVRVAGEQEVWVKRLSDGGVALALFNRGDRPAYIAAIPANVGFYRFRHCTTCGAAWTCRLPLRRLSCQRMGPSSFVQRAPEQIEQSFVLSSGGLP